ncbi:Tetratricopeptide repeat protein 25, partial [Borealophlyctis nickersoniae]
LSNYPAAIAMYTRALSIRPSDAHCLSCRARCLTLTGDHVSAIRDADAALAIDPDSVAASIAKADALYASGEFENALVVYHRGAARRSDVDEFTAGVGRCRDAIMKAVGMIDVDKLRSGAVVVAKPTKPGGASHVVTPQNRAKPLAPRYSTATPSARRGGGGGGGGAADRAKSAHPRPGTADATETLERILLEDLYEDRVFLHSLFHDPSIMRAANGEVGALVKEGCAYLDGRVEFWRQTNPAGVRKDKERSMGLKKKGPRKAWRGNESPGSSGSLDRVNGVVGKQRSVRV